MAFLKNFVPHALWDCKNDELLALEQGDMPVVVYEAKLYTLSHCDTQLLTTEEKRINLVIEGLNYDLQVLSMHMLLQERELMKFLTI